MVLSSADGIVISITGRVAGMPMDASRYACSISSMRFSKWHVPMCMGPGPPPAGDGKHAKLGSLSTAQLILNAPHCSERRHRPHEHTPQQ
jgi:hypothetical protein